MQATSRYTMRLLVLLAATLIAAGLAVLIPSQVVSVSPPAHRPMLAAIFAGVGIFTGLAALRWHRHAVHESRWKPSGPSKLRKVEQVSPTAVSETGAADVAISEAALEALWSQVASSRAAFTDQGRVASTYAAVAAWKMTDRITEAVTLEDWRLNRSVTRQLHLDGVDGVGEWLFPALRRRKNILLDEIDVMLDGKQHILPSHNENVARSLWISVGLLSQAFDWSRNSELLGRMLGVVTCPRELRASAEYAKLRDDMTTFMAQHAEMPETGDEERQLARKSFDRNKRAVLRYMDYMADHHVMYVSMPSDRTVVLKVSYSERRTLQARSFSTWIRRWLGLPNYRYSLRLPDALDSPTYHLRAQSPDGTYCYDVVPRAAPLISAVTNDPITSLLPHGVDLRPAATHGTPAVHLYARGLHDLERDARENAGAKQIDVTVDMDFRIIPPGLSTAIVGLSLFLTSVVTSVALWHGSVFPDHVPVLLEELVPFGKDPDEGSTIQGSVLAVVLALPAIFSAWVASRFDSPGMRKVTPVLLLELITSPQVPTSFVRSRGNRVAC